ncbi:SDR family oxidoreductase [Pyxidicoccus parkwayensis]|uniref:SDR family oxidoreductase n=1 Tax=Pyxidicoccus parkwayensis TaxID=2813578 RepID=A0ABX7P9G6_9BACT|nr:SDR family oxidoreductase [Pyxidicoccus parkwaysis]QSQ27089.1 SDR family oxidoreductase [Pyxidicoccus parkwaysis]
MADVKKVAFITGGNRGIGLQTSRELGQKGFEVIIGARDATRGAAALQELRTDGVKAEFVLYDAKRPETDQAVKDYIESRHGKLDVLVNNAGLLREELLGKNASNVPEDVLRETFETNLFAVVRLTQTLLPLVKKAPAGRIVNVSSILGSLGMHSAEGSPIAAAKSFAYNASKAALNAFTVHLADELKGTSVKVNSAHPGWVKTELGGPHAPMDVADSARTSVRLATLGADGPSGGFFHENDRLPW